MPAARSMIPIANVSELDAAARRRGRVRVRGVVVAVGDGKSGAYKNRWLHLETVGAKILITSTTSSPLGCAAPGAGIDLALTMTGMLDLSAELYHGQHAQLLNLQDAITA